MYIVREYAGVVLLLLMVAAPVGALLLLIWGGRYLLDVIRAVRREAGVKRRGTETSRHLNAKPVINLDESS
jgi:hypothetical protein